MDYASIGREVRRWRIERGYTSMNELAAAAGLHRNTVAKLELGGAITTRTLAAIAGTLRVDAGLLMSGMTSQRRRKTAQAKKRRR